MDRYHLSSSELMELAAKACAGVLVDKAPGSRYVFFCGTGNNGGDGLAMARLLNEQEILVEVFVVGNSATGSSDFKLNVQRAIDSDVPIEFLNEMPRELEIEKDDIVVDAIFGSGLNRPIEGWRANLIKEINLLSNPIVSIDIPSGLNADLLREQDGAIINAEITLTLEVPKRAMLFPENDSYVGKLVIIPLGLDPEFADNEHCSWMFVDDLDTVQLLRPLDKYRHKGTRGHVQVIAGSRGMMGAAMLSCYAAMRTGAGKVTACIPNCGLELIQTALPEVICKTDVGRNVCEKFDVAEGATALLIGPGCSTGAEATQMIDDWLKKSRLPVVADADALNIIAREGWLNRLPTGSIITPHVGEFDRLFGTHLSNFDRLETQAKMSHELKICIVLKGAHTRITAPNSFVYINSTGNPGMATAGSGDVLSGMISSLLAQGYEPLEASLLGVYLHGLAGDVAADARGMDSMIARDIIECIGDAFIHLRGYATREG